ncbi:hypothetical protein HELRODRAFT_75816, partial [Helobdella robusta]|uniref:Uncharacterized protein n=1 Tax=Helobdella robusta TaxID=6412 RepID=T1G2A7_HELRO
CESNEHQCRNGRCISMDFLCDGIHDCPEKDDESDQVLLNRSCPNDLVYCEITKKCMKSSQMCDRYQDCPDDSDESNCSQCTSLSDEYRCNGKTMRCIPNEQYCDQVQQCPDGDDEQSCSCYLFIHFFFNLDEIPNADFDLYNQLLLV